jgi:hypothetical protein
MNKPNQTNQELSSNSISQDSQFWVDAALKLRVEITMPVESARQIMFLDQMVNIFFPLKKIP